MITAGASTPSWVIENVVLKRVCELGDCVSEGNSSDKLFSESRDLGHQEVIKLFAL